MSLRSQARILALPVVVIVCAVVARLSIAGIFAVPTRSMEPTLIPGDQVLATRLGNDEPLGRGDVVVFEDRDGRALVKRIVGVAGDSLAIDGAHVVVNGTTLAEPYALHQPASAPSTHLVPAGHLFVMGDNRAHSEDSRAWGFVPRGAVIGRARIVCWSRAKDGPVRWHRIVSPVE